MALVGAWTTVCNRKDFKRLETNQVIQLEMQGVNSKNRTVRIITIQVVFLCRELINVSQSEVTEASGESVNLNHLVHVFSKVSSISTHICYICTALDMNSGTSSSLCSR